MSSRSPAHARAATQLRLDEARRFVETALGEGDARGLAAAMALLMGLRASEITNRDVDDAARVLWIERAKTRAGDRRLEVPEVLRPRLAALVAGRDSDAPCSATTIATGSVTTSAGCAGELRGATNTTRSA
jgi:integrase